MSASNENTSDTTTLTTDPTPDITISVRFPAGAFSDGSSYPGDTRTFHFLAAEPSATLVIVGHHRPCGIDMPHTPGLMSLIARIKSLVEGDPDASIDHLDAEDDDEDDADEDDADDGDAESEAMLPHNAPERTPDVPTSAYIHAFFADGPGAAHFVIPAPGTDAEPDEETISVSPATMRVLGRIARGEAVDLSPDARPSLTSRELDELMMARRLLGAN